MISSPDHTRIFLSDRSFSAILSSKDNTSVCFPLCVFIVFFLYRVIDGDQHFEHMENVRLYHHSRQEQTAPPSGNSSVMGEANPSSSFLISTLRYHSSYRCPKTTVLLLSCLQPNSIHEFLRLMFSFSTGRN